MQVRGSGAWTAVEREGDRPRRGVAALRDIGRVEHRADLLAGLVVQRERAGGRGVGKRALVGERDRFFGDGVGGQQPQHALRVGGLRGCDRGVQSNREEKRNNAKGEHGGPRKLGCSACCSGSTSRKVRRYLGFSGLDSICAAASFFIKRLCLVIRQYEKQQQYQCPVDWHVACDQVPARGPIGPGCARQTQGISRCFHPSAAAGSSPPA